MSESEFTFAELEAIDATLRGEAVDPVHAELAELALLLSADRPTLPAAAGERLDQRMAALRPDPQRRWRLQWAPRPGALTAAGTVFVALLVALVIVLPGGGSPGPTLPHGVARSPALAASHGADTNSASGGYSAANSAPGTFSNGAALPPAAGVPAPLANGRKQIQSAQLQLTAPWRRIDQVAEELYRAVGELNGIVKSSQVNQSAANSYANFELSIPTQNLQQAMTELSTLAYAHVVSRTDQTQDVNDQYLNEKRALADARALRTSLLKQLASATTTAQIDSMTARIHDAEASIASDEATLNALNGKLSYSSLSVQINAGDVIFGPVAQPSSGGFTLGKAAHDAKRVLIVAAGVLLIALAVLVPLGLIALIAWRIALSVRRSGRERALDAA
jgi:hypothetical protein